MHRAYGFSADFPQPKAVTDRAALAERYGIVLEATATWAPSYELCLLERSWS